MLQPEEAAYYSRQLRLPELGRAGQERLRAARVLVVGAGGLGCPLLQYLAAAGVGHIGIVDGDTVHLSNLHRQVLYGYADIGRKKAEAAREHLLQLNPHVEIIAYGEYFTAANALDLLANYDVVADGSDNFPTRYVVNDACVLTGKVNVYAAVSRLEGQIAVFNYLYPDGRRGPHYRDLYPEPPLPGAVPNCAESGVLGVLPGIVGAMQASEVIKIITGIGEPLAGKLALFELTTSTWRVLHMMSHTHTPVTKLDDHLFFCADNQAITSSQLRQMQAENITLQLIDVREPEEHERFHIGGCLLMPLSEISERIGELDPNQVTILYCQSGRRSALALALLNAEGKFQRLYHLEGGLDKW